MAVNAPPPHDNNFDALRLIAALLVLVSHMFAVTGRPEPATLPGLSLGGLAVLVFFSLSGYLVTQSWQRDPHPLRFLTRRLLRIWPAMAVATLLGAFVLSPPLTGQSIGQLLHNHQFLSYLKNLTLSPVYHTFDGFTSLRYHTINGAAWTVPLEFACYLLLLLFAGVPRLGLPRLFPLWLTLLLAILLLNGGQTWLDHRHHSPWLYLLQFSLFFAAGGCLYLFPRLRTDHRLLAAALALAGLVLLCHQTCLAALLSVPLLSIRLGTANWPYCRRAGRFGDVSYGLYLYAWPAQQLVVLAFGAAAPFGLLLLTAILLALACGFLSWLIVEKPSLALKRYLDPTPAV